MVSIEGIEPVEQLFHNVRINVYPKKVRFEDIKFWKENLRTLLAFELLEKESNKSLDELTLKEITEFLAKKRELALEKLAKSIERNGVRVPLIILQDGTLLDGNRRYFACQHLLQTSESRPSALDSIPVWVIRNSDIDERKKQKILAEANFLPEEKVEWPLEVRAKVIYDCVTSCKQSGMSREEVYKEVTDLYGVDKDTVDAYLDAMKLSKEFVRSAPRAKRDSYREIVQDKFVYFWEFRNKAFTKKLNLNKRTELPKVKKIFYSMVANDLFKNLKQVEPMARAIRDRRQWGILRDSNGAKIDQVEALYKSEKAIRSAEDKIRNFNSWLNELNTKALSEVSITLLKKTIEKCQGILKRRV
ncbi:MAG: ParB/RepB/Spo0J family partition protein [Candidatus Altiarchaeota archaeon]